MASTPAGKIFYGGGDLAVGIILLLNSVSLGGFSGALGFFLVARGALTMLGIGI